MPSVIVAGGGLAGMAAAAALGGDGYAVTLFESRAFLGGRASSFPLAPSAGGEELIDNCQHILLRCCVNLLDFYRRLGVLDRVCFHRQFHFIEPGGRVSVLRAGRLPAPFHFAGALMRLPFLSPAEKLAVARALAALRRRRSCRQDLDRITMLDWLQQQRQPPRAVERFWRPVLVSAVNEEPARMAASHGFQVFRLGFLARSDSYEMGVPKVRLCELYALQAWRGIGSVEIRFRSPVERVLADNGRAVGAVVNGEVHRADYYVCALPFERAPDILPGLDLDLSDFEHSPITGIHLWFDRPVTDLPHAALLDRTIQWMFNKHEGRYVQAVVSASRGLLEVGRREVIALAVRELAEFFPRVRQASLEKAHVVKEARATFSAKPGLERKRPAQATRFSNLFLAGDWTRTGWPATMEGAVRSGYLAAEAVTRAAGRPRRFLLPDVG